MPLQYKIDVLDALKEKGFTTYTLRKDTLLSQSTIQKLREKKGLAWENIERLCELLDCQPSDFMEYVKEEKQGRALIALPIFVMWRDIAVI